MTQEGRDDPAADAEEAASERRELLVMRGGGRAFGVFADEAEEVTKLRGEAAPLPFAPPGVLGVAAVRGRMRTLIDPLPLLARADPQTRPGAPDEPGPGPAGDAARAPGRPPRLAVVLRGDEQLALAVERVERVVEIPPHAITPFDPPLDFARGRLTRDGLEIVVLDPARVFDALMRGHERRRVR